MTEPSTNPVYVALLFILRCLVPLAVLFGISYLLRKMGFVAGDTPEPPDDRENEVVAIQAPGKPAANKKEVTGAGGRKASSKKDGKGKPKTSGESPGRKTTVEKSRSHSK